MASGGRSRWTPRRLSQVKNNFPTSYGGHYNSYMKGSLRHDLRTTSYPSHISLAISQGLYSFFINTDFMKSSQSRCGIKAGNGYKNSGPQARYNKRGRGINSFLHGIRTRRHPQSFTETIISSLKLEVSDKVTINILSNYTVENLFGSNTDLPSSRGYDRKCFFLHTPPSTRMSGGLSGSHTTLGQAISSGRAPR